MGKIKNPLLERQSATIGDLKKERVIGLTVECPKPCGHVGVVAFAKLGLPDDTPLSRVIARITCSFCRTPAELENVMTWRGDGEGWGMIPLGDPARDQ